MVRISHQKVSPDVEQVAPVDPEVEAECFDLVRRSRPRKVARRADVEEPASAPSTASSPADPNSLAHDAVDEREREVEELRRALSDLRTAQEIERSTLTREVAE